jgi:hypothetical protein
MEQVAQLTVPALPNLCVTDLSAGEGSISELAGASADGLALLGVRLASVARG